MRKIYYPFRSHNLRKILLILFLSIVFNPSNVKAQGAILVLLFGEKLASENFYVTMKAGLNLSYFHNNISGSSPALNVNFGFSGSIRLKDGLYLAPEFLPLSKKSVNHIEEMNTGNPDLDFSYRGGHSRKTISMLEFSLPLIYHLNDKMSVGVGPQVSTISSVKNFYTKSLGSDSKRYSQNVSEEYHKVLYGLMGEYNLGLTERGWKGYGLKIRYSLSLNDLRRSNPDKAFQISSLSLMLTLPFVDLVSKK